MQTADVNYQDFEQSAQSAQDERLLVKFFVKEVRDNAKSLTEGRNIFKEVEYVDIKIPGNRTGGACHPAQFRDKQRFPRHYEAFVQRREMPVEGTPLSEWPIMTRTMVEELAFHNVKTVEQLLSMSDTHASKFMGINDYKAKAKAWLEKTDETARINEIESLKEANNEKDEKILSLETQMTELMARFDLMDSKSIVESAVKTTPKKGKAK
jgi:hypothetical protein